MVAFDRRTTPDPHDDYFCTYVGRRDSVRYAYDHQALIDKYGYAMMMTPHIDKALAGAIGEQAYIARFRTEEERDAFLTDACHRI